MTAQARAEEVPTTRSPEKDLEKEWMKAKICIIIVVDKGIGRIGWNDGEKGARKSHYLKSRGFVG